MSTLDEHIEILRLFKQDKDKKDFYMHAGLMMEVHFDEIAGMYEKLQSAMKLIKHYRDHVKVLEEEILEMIKKEKDSANQGPVAP